MAMGDATDRLGSINPSDLIGHAVVEPRAVENLANAFRSGFITADDIIQRSGESAQLKKKAEIQMLSEQTSPEAIAARAAQRGAATAQAGLVGAQAGAALPDVQSIQELQRQKVEQEKKAIENSMQYEQYPTAKIFDTYASVLGLQTPMTPDKQVDWAQKAVIGAQISAHMTQQELARKKLENITTEKSADGTILSAFTKQGIKVDTNEVKALNSQAYSPFTAISPGTTVTPGAPMVTPTSAIATPGAREWAMEPQNLVERDTRLSSLLPGDKPVVQPQTSQTPVVESRIDGVPAFGTPVPGGVSLGPPKAKDAPDKFLPAEGVKDLNLNRDVVNGLTRLHNAYEELVKNPNLTGYLQGRALSTIQAQEFNKKIADFKQQSTALLAPLAKGVFGETGVLSDKDIARYAAVLPSLNDTPEIGRSKIAQLNSTIQSTLRTKLEGWQMSGYDTGRWQDLVNTTKPGATAAPSAPAGEVINFPSTGRRMVIDSNGLFRLVK